MTKIYAQGNYIVIEANNERKTFQKKGVGFEIVNYDGLYSLNDKGLPIGDFNYSEVKKEDGSGYATPLEFETFLFENTGNFNSGADVSPNVIGSLKTTDTAPTAQGLYILSDVGTYANLGGLVTTAGKINYAYFNGTTWSKVEVAVQNGKSAYEVAVANGFVGTEAQWLASLKPAVLQTMGTSETDVMSQKAVTDEIVQLAGDVSQKITGIPSKNLFDKNTVTEGYYVNYINGNLVSSQTYCASDWIPVKPNTSYARTGAWMMAFYDANKTYISGDASNEVVTSPSNAAFARVSMAPISKKDIFQFEEGTAKTAYESFGLKLNGENIYPQSIQLDNYPLVSNGKIFDDIKLGYVSASNDLSFLATNPWNIGSGATMTWNDNVNEFTSGLNFVQIVQTSTGQHLKVEIPTYLRIVGRKLKFVFRYKSDKQIDVRLYLWNSSGWVNNAGAISNILPISSSEKLLSFERAYEAGATHIVFFINQFATATIKIGSIQLFAESGGYESIGSAKQKTVASDGSGDYTSIRAAVNANVGTINSPCTIYVKNGTYNEIDIAVGDYTTVVGESRDGVVVITDGSSTANAPSDFYSGAPINTIPKSGKHQWRILKNAKVMNLTSIVNDVKYSNHSDGSGVFDYTFENVNFIRLEDKINGSGNDAKNNYLFLIGIGSRANQKHRYVGCTFEYVINTVVGNIAAIYYHNWNNESAPCLLQIDKCYSQSASLAWLDDLGSTQKDVVQLTDSFGDIVFSANGYYWSIPNIDVLYSFNIQAKNLNGSFLPNADRPNIWAKINADTIIKTYPIFAVGDYCKRNKPVWVAATNGVDATHQCVYVTASYSYLKKIE